MGIGQDAFNEHIGRAKKCPKCAQLEEELRVEKQKHLDTSNWAMEQQDRADRLAAKLGGE